MTDKPIVTQPPLSDAFDNVEGLDPLQLAQERSARARALFEGHGDGDAESWMDDYWSLIAEGWSWRQAVYILWSAQPSDRRSPKTQGELATQVLGLTSDRTIRVWREKNPHIEARIADLTSSVLMKHRAEVLNALASMAAEHDYKAHADRKLYLEMTGDYVPRSVQGVVGIPVDEDDVRNASTEELRRMVQQPVQGEVIDVDVIE